MPSYNCESTIVESIESVINQTYRNWELLVYDDCSTDKTLEILETYALSDSRIHVTANKTNQGPGTIRNIGISKSRGTYIAFLDSDDTWDPKKLITQYKFMTEGQYKFSHHAYQYFTKGTQGYNYSKKIFPSKIINYFNYLTKRGYGYCNTFMFHKSLKNLIVFDEKTQVAEDFLAFLAYFQEGSSFGINQILGYVRKSNISRSSSKIKVFLYMIKIYYIKVEGNIFNKIIYFILYLLNSIRLRLKA